MRSLVSYEDISFPTSLQNSFVQASLHKKRKISKKLKERSHETYPTQSVEQKIIDNESRELTHEEIWDDTALIDAWNAATEEYEAHHDSSKAWKDEGTHQSSLWYNSACNNEDLDVNSNRQSFPDPSDRDDSHPLDFNTFIPTNDPLLPTGSSHDSEAESPLQNAGVMVSRDEAFSRAMGAMYWTGYWTAMYHASLSE